jgi:hypothetical protein
MRAASPQRQTASLSEIRLSGTVQHFMDIDCSQDRAAFIANLDAGILQGAAFGNVLTRHILGTGHGLGLRFVKAGKLIAFMVGNLCSVLHDTEEISRHVPPTVYLPSNKG